jgi:pyruvate dehydrogenase E2 component (dihydrolipoamide acetyltransferase)
VDGVTEKILVPDIGDFDAVDVVEVLVTAGDRVAVEDPLITLESDKATMDVPSPLAGKVVEVKVKTGDKVGEGAVILILEIDAATDRPPAHLAARDEVDAALGEQAADSEASSSAQAPDAAEDRPSPDAVSRDDDDASIGEEMADQTPSEDGVGPAPVDEFPFSKAYASPAVRRFARELGVDLNRVRGTGRKGRILKEDVQGFVKKVMAEPAATGGTAVPPMPVVDFSKFGEVERQSLSRIQQLSLTHVHRSWLHVPHVTQHDEADVTEMEAFRKAHGEEAKLRGFKLTPVAFLMKASVAALKKYPRVNSSLDPDGEHVILKKYYHLGIAVDTEEGLVVPVIRSVDQKGVFELAEELGEVSERARQGKLKLDEMRGGSFTLTSLGGIGGTAFTPIVNAPEVAILGISRLQRKPVWTGEEFEPRLMLPISLSYDHRVIDGALAVRFTTYLCNVLGDIRQLVL